MKTMAIGELKAHFSEVLDEVKQGHPVAVGYGRRRKKLAVIVPYEQYAAGAKRRLGVMEGRAAYSTTGEFAISDEELLSS